MTWDASNLYIGIVNANLSEGAVIYIAGNPQNPPTCCSDADGNLTGFNYDGTDFSSLPFRAKFVTYFKDGYREYRNSDGSGGWTGATANYGAYATTAATQNTREVAIPWSAITGGGIPSSFVFFGYLTSSGGYVYGQVPTDNNISGFIGTSASATQYYAIVNTGNGTSTPPFSNEQPAGFSGADKAGFYHNTFDPFYRDQEGAVPENTQVTLRFRTLHSSGIWGVTVRAYLFDTGIGRDHWARGYPHAVRPEHHHQRHRIRHLEGHADDAVHADRLLLQVQDQPGPDQRLVQRRLRGRQRQRPQRRHWRSHGWRAIPVLPDHGVRPQLPDAGMAAERERVPHHARPFPQRRSDQRLLPAGATTGCPVYYGTQQAFTYNLWNTQICDPRNQNSGCYSEFSNQFYGGDLLGVQNELDYIQSLGIDTIYMNPIFSARSYHRYDTDNYLHIDPALGGDAAFASLSTEMQRRGMQVILDGVFNHASSDGMYFDRYDRYGGTAAQHRRLPVAGVAVAHVVQLHRQQRALPDG